ncbi:MAG: 4'-phosphopantetheinyl transferase superfamily protein [Oscillospiraceae bacterium]|nr:4'-phosphopantetheinyl transferase superfamily protein [Oscillospiraceae bacterium]
MDVILKVISLCDDTLDENILSALSPQRKERVLAAKNHRAKAHAAWGEIALKLALREFETPPGEPEYGANEYGKPFLKNAPHIHFSLSSTTRAVCAAVWDREVGVDIERRREAEISVARKFAPSEQEYVSGDLDRFFEIWTKKEAYMKYRGMGFNLPLKSFSVLGREFFTARREELFIALCAGDEQVCVNMEFLSEKEALEILKI